MSCRYQDHCSGKLLFIAILATVVGVGSQYVQPSLAQDLGQMAEQAKEKIGGALG
jgi:hypothetical protein